MMRLVSGGTICQQPSGMTRWARRGSEQSASSSMISGSVMNIIRAQRRYCPTSGSFTPRLSRICSRTSGGIVSGRFAVGSDGDSFTIMKMMKLMKISAGTARISRRMMYVTMAAPRSGGVFVRGSGE
jgi:hypothetical protein